MTTIGKILVFLNLVFSLVAGGLFVVLYTTRTNWESAFEKKENLQTIAVRQRDEASRERDAIQKKYDAEVVGMRQQRDDAFVARDKAVDSEKKAKAEAELVTAAERKKAADAQATIDSSTARRDQVRELEATVDAERKAKFALIEEKNKERADKLKAQVEMKYFQTRAVELEEKVKDLARALVKAQSGTSGVVVSRKKGEENPPPDNVEGKVVTVDPDDSLVKLSIGSDSGLAAGHTLKVFRLHPIPERSKYLGVIEIISVRPHESVGRPVKAMPEKMQPGDRVASRLLIGN